MPLTLNSYLLFRKKRSNKLQILLKITQMKKKMKMVLLGRTRIQIMITQMKK